MRQDYEPEWRSQLIPSETVVEFATVDPDNRPMRLAVDGGTEVPHLSRAVVRQSSQTVTLLFTTADDLSCKMA